MSAKIDLSDLANFVRVAERENFSAAARELGVPTSTVSRGVARLEDSLGVRLLERTTRKVVLTASGKALFAEVQSPLAALATAADTVASFHEQPCGELRVTAPADLGPAIADLAHSFLLEQPNVTIDVILTNRYVDLVGEGVDIAIRAGKLADSSLIARKVGEGAVQLFAAPEYLERKGTPTAPADLEGHDIVAFRPKNGRVTWALENGSKTVKVDVKSRLSGDDFMFVRAAIVAGAGIGLMPEGAAIEALKDGTLVRVLAPWEIPGAPLSVVIASSKHVAPRVIAFRDHVLKNFKFKTAF